MTVIRKMGLALMLMALGLVCTPALVLAQEETTPETPVEEAEEYIEEAQDAAEDAAEAADKAADALAQDMTILDQLEQRGDFTSLIAAVEQAGLADALKSESNLTLFAPNDAAFATLAEGTLENMSASDLAALLQYHLLVDKVVAEEAIAAGELISAQGQPLMVVKSDDGTVMVGDARVIEADIEATNGVIHVIDAVLVPTPTQEMEQPADDDGMEDDGDGTDQ